MAATEMKPGQGSENVFKFLYLGTKKGGTKTIKSLPDKVGVPTGKYTMTYFRMDYYYIIMIV